MLNCLKMQRNQSKQAAGGDGDRGLRQITYRGGTFWIRDDALPANSIGYLFAEHDWLAETNPREMVQKGDVVLDIGAHVGVFTAKALELKKVIIICGIQ